MFTIANIAHKSLITSSRYGFAGMPFSKKRIPTKNDLPKYDIVIVGAGLGSVLAHHLDHLMTENVKILVAYDTPIY